MFAKIYDELMSDIDYEQIYTFLKPYLNKNDLILDAGCGSGYLLEELLKNEYDVLGIDHDDQMLSIALDRLRTSDLKAPLYNHDLRDRLAIKVDVIISFFDVMNYFKGVKNVFHHIRQALNDKGRFIFDVYKVSVLSDYDGYEEIEDIPLKYQWSIKSNKNRLKHTITVDNDIHQLIQYVEPLNYYLDILNVLGYKDIKVENGPDIRKHYIIASL